MTRQRQHGTSDAVFAVSSTHYSSTQQSAERQSAFSPRPQVMSTIFHRAALCAGLFAATGIAVSVAPQAHAAPRSSKVVGVPGWTSGSNTYLRVRPGTATPPVAKVPRHTRLYVWGTFNGWYRVETHDGKFGWIYHDYLSVPEAHKLKELSHRKAKAASDRTGHQTLYGSTDMLREYHAQYGGRGAIKGLEKQGVRLASSTSRKTRKAVVSAPRVAAAPKTAAPKVVTPKVVVPKVVSAPKTAAPRVMSTRIVSAPATSVVKVPAVKAPRVVKAEARAIPTLNAPLETAQPVVIAKPVPAAPRVEAPRVETRVETPRVETPRVESAPLGGQMLGFAASPAMAETAPVAPSRPIAERVERSEVVPLGTPLVPSRIADARWERERVQELERLRALQEQALAQRSQVAPEASPLSVQRVLEERRAEQAREQEAQRLENARRTAQARRMAEIKAAEDRAVQERSKAKRLAAQKEAQRKAAQRKAAQRKTASSRSRRSRVAAQREAQRQLLRQRMGGTTESVVTQIPPLTPDELLRAREQYLSSRRKTRPTAPAAPQLTPSSFEGNSGHITHAVASDAITAEMVESTDGAATSSSVASSEMASSWGAFADFRPAYSGQANIELTTNRQTLTSEKWWTAPLWSANTRASAQQKPAATQQKPASTLGGQTSTPVSTQNAPLRPARIATTKTVTKSTAKSTAKPRVVQARPIHRGGSPRDYARYMQNRMAKNNSFGDEVVSKAMSYRGMPYVFGSASPRRGFDCSGLIYSVLRQRGLNPPRTASGLASYGTRVSRAEAKPGDIVLFANTYKRGVSHCGIYIGNNKFVHAARTGSGVRVDSLSSRYYGGKFHSIRRVK